MKKRNVAMCIVFTIITCGIYGLYWLVMLNDSVNELANPPKKTSGVMVVVLTIVTAGIYGIYWAYKMGDLLDTALTQRNMPAQNRKIIYLVLQVLCLGLVGWAMMQTTINTMLPDAE